jgi:ABC-type Na+ efflux pump permease subunit
MNAQRIRAILEKEWAQGLCSRSSRVRLALAPIFAGVASVGLFMLLSPELVAKTGFLNVADPQSPEVKVDLLRRASFMLDFLLAFFVTLPMVSASQFAVIGMADDKKSQSLEPLLATPLTGAEFLVGKTLAATIPAVASGWMSFLAFAVVASSRGVSRSLVFGSLFGPLWLTAVVCVAPLLVVLVAVLAFFFASRARDTHRAEVLCQEVTGILMVVPLVGVASAAFLSQGHDLHLNRTLAWIVFALSVLTGMLFLLCLRLFSREAILFRWR